MARNIKDFVIYPGMLHHHIDLGDCILRETFVSDFMINYIIYDKYGKWVLPVISLTTSSRQLS